MLHNPAAYAALANEGKEASAERAAKKRKQRAQRDDGGGGGGRGGTHPDEQAHGPAKCVAQVASAQSGLSNWQKVALCRRSVSAIVSSSSSSASSHVGKETRGTRSNSDASVKDLIKLAITPARCVRELRHQDMPAQQKIAIWCVDD
jgi:hypothetical protein